MLKNYIVFERWNWWQSSIFCISIPNHELKFKIGVPIMLLRNIDQSSGLCNGTRLSVTQLGNRVIEAQIISIINVGHIFIPRLSLNLSDSKIPLKFLRRQFPICLSFAMTINKSLGQSLQYVGIYLQSQFFLMDNYMWLSQELPVAVV